MRKQRCSSVQLFLCHVTFPPVFTLFTSEIRHRLHSSGTVIRSVQECRDEQLRRVDNVPDGQANGKQGKRDVEETPVANDVAIELLAPHSLLDALKLRDMFLRPRHERAGASKI